MNENRSSGAACRMFSGTEHGADPRQRQEKELGVAPLLFSARHATRSPVPMPRLASQPAMRMTRSWSSP